MMSTFPKPSRRGSYRDAGAAIVRVTGVRPAVLGLQPGIGAADELVMTPATLLPPVVSRPLTISVVMPAHNEERFLDSAVAEVVAGLHARRAAFEVIVVENGSTDTTAAVADRLAARYAEVRALRSPAPDYGRALRSGFEAAGGDVVVNFDVDFVDLEFLDAAVETVASAAWDRCPAVVVGSKRARGASDDRGGLRHAATAVFGTLLKVGFGLKVSDTHGIKLLRRAPLEAVVARCRFGLDIFDTELVLRAEREGLVVTERPVRVVETRPARTPITRRVPRTLAGLVRLRCALWAEGRHRGAIAVSPGRDRAVMGMAMSGRPTTFANAA
jgi:glycosyltransferase AglD